MATETKAEKAAREKSERIAASQAKKLAKAKPDKGALANVGAKTAAEAAAPQPKDDKQAKTMGVVARGRMVKNEGVYKRPGQFVRASAQEIEKLRQSGHLVDEGRIADPMGRSGPSVLIEDAAAKGAREPA